MTAFKLRLLGSVMLEGLDGPLGGPVAQKHRLGLLALLAVAPGGVSRDKLAASLWPEANAERTRHLLSQSIYVLRKELDDVALEVSGGLVRLNPAVVEADVAGFERALEDGDPERAIGLYGGPFLDGFFLPDALEFERWADGERRRLADRFTHALEAVVEARAARGDRVGAALAWRRLAGEDPYNGRIALRLMQALDASGDRTGALEHARLHAELLRKDFEAEPDPAVLAYAERLRAEPASRLVIPPPEPPPRTDEGSPVRAIPKQFPPAAPARRHRRLRFWPALIGGTLLLALGVASLGRANRPSATDASASNRVAVLPFHFQGDSGVSYLGSGITNLLSSNLDGAGDVRTTDPRALLAYVTREGDETLDPEGGQAIAERFGAGLFVLGDIVEADGRLRINATLYGGEAPQMLTKAAVEGTPDQLFRLVDDLTAQLLAGRLRGPPRRLARIAAFTTHSVPALKAYLEGEDHYRSARFAPAVEAFQRAIALDTTFALAYYRLSMAADWGGVGRIAPREAAQRAVRYSARLSEHDRQLVNAFLAWRLGDADEAERLYRLVVARYPDDLEAWYQFGEVLFHLNPTRGRSFTEARHPFQQFVRLDLDDRDAESRGVFVHLAHIAAREGKREELLAWSRRADRLAPEDTLGGAALRAFALGDLSAQDRVMAELRKSTYDAFAGTIVARLAADLQDPVVTARIARILTSPSHPAGARGWAHVVLAYAEAARGRRRAAEAELRALETIDAAIALEHRAYLASLSFLGSSQQEREKLRGALLAWDPRVARRWEHTLSEYPALHPQLREYLLGQLSLLLGHSSLALAGAARLDHADGGELRPFARAFAGSLRAHAAAQDGQTEQALQLLDRSELVIWPEVRQHIFGSQALERYLRAELLHQTGRDEEALRWLGTIAEATPYDLVFAAPAHLRQAEIFERRGDRSRATAHYRRFITLWRDCDPELRPRVREAERRLADLERRG